MRRCIYLRGQLQKSRTFGPTSLVHLLESLAGDVYQTSGVGITIAICSEEGGLVGAHLCPLWQVLFT